MYILRVQILENKKKKKSSINFEKISDLFVQAMNYNLQITEEKEKKNC